MQKISLTTTYKPLLFAAIVKYRNMKDKTAAQRRHLFNMENEYREIVKLIEEKKVRQLRLPSSMKVFIVDNWNPIVKHVNQELCAS